MAFAAALVAVALWLLVLGLPWQAWRTRERLEADAGASDTDLSDVTVLMPARNEAAVIGQTTAALLRQGRGLRIILVDDQSTDATAAAARTAGNDCLQILSGKPLPDGWTGKLWALEQARRAAQTPLLLLMDADIALAPGTIFALQAQRSRGGYQLVSLMAALSMRRPWEKLLLPAFIYFFKLLYPFRLSNSQRPWVAAAAGGCIMLEARSLADIGGFAPLRHALIDDCTLARAFKARGFRTWIGLTHAARSLRPYPTLGSVADMVARTAYTQLRHSVTLLLLCTVAMLVGFWIAPLAIVVGTGVTQLMGAAALAMMALSYWPVLRFYRLSPVLSLTLPLAASLYLGMTWLSAWRYWCGAGATWKARSYGR